MKKMHICSLIFPYFSVFYLVGYWEQVACKGMLITAVKLL